jgi:Outer membrane protein beta-barrel domain
MPRAPWFVCGLLVVSMATSASAAEINVGVVGGGLFNNMAALAASTVTDEAVFSQAENQRVFGGMGGVILEWSWPTFGALRFEPRYMRKGTELWLRLQTGEEVRGPVDLDYVSFPVMFKSTMFKSKPVQLVLISGLSADYLVSGKFQGEDVKGQFESWDFTVTARIGIQGKVGENGVLGVHFNVASSLAGIDKDQPGDEKVKNNGLGFAVEYTHSLGGSK